MKYVIINLKNLRIFLSKGKMERISSAGISVMMRTVIMSIAGKIKDSTGYLMRLQATNLRIIVLKKAKHIPIQSSHAERMAVLPCLAIMIIRVFR